MDTGVAKRMRNNSNIVNFYAKEYIRERLESSLDKFIDKQLIMVVAPSGYGKSTLVGIILMTGHIIIKCGSLCRVKKKTTTGCGKDYARSWVNIVKS